MKRIGIYSGTFNPVHAGHISFALQALNEAELDRVYLMPERYRSGKQDVAHYAHRVAMVRQAIKPHSKLSLIESPEVSFSVERTLPRLKKEFKHAKLVFLFGSDAVSGMESWPNIERLLKSSGLVVGVRNGQHQQTGEAIKRLPVKPKQLFILPSFAPDVSSTKIREALRLRTQTEGILASVERYSNQNWLYISLA
jgi:nicotinate-nucleotide adenylyltransferase